jgi:hypothetical protein
MRSTRENMNNRFLVFLFIALEFAFTGCHGKKDRDEQRYTWSSDAPLTIPYRTRIQRLEKGNLVRNPSFETGRTFNLDSSTSSFVIDYWQQIGRHVEWVVDSVHPDQVYSGHRAIRITRKTAYENDEQGEGVMSDFIKVIPGNYSLYLFAKIDSVLPAKARLGTRMYDNIEISLYYYDRNKIQVKADHPFPQAKQFINTSFKSLSFANYDKISSFGWGKVIGKSHSFPFPEGDIPSDAHYVRIFIGLKGSGTLWIDSVNFSFTTRNFSVAEKMQSFTDTSYRNTAVAIIPTPKKISRMESVIFYKPDLLPEQLPLIVIPENSDPLVAKAAEMIRQKLQASMDQFSGKRTGYLVRIVHGLNIYQKDAPRLIINLGNTELQKEFGTGMPRNEIADKPQGYCIWSPGAFPELVLIGAHDPVGMYYAALTLVQMLDHHAPVFHNARIVDYPDFSNRFYTLRETDNPIELAFQKAGTQEMIRYKMNGAFVVSANGDHASNILRKFAPVCAEAECGLFSLMGVPEFLTPESSTLTYSYPMDLSNLQPSGAEKKCRVSTFNKREEGVDELVMQPVFHNQLLDNSNYSEVRLHLGPHVKCIYSGSSYFSLQTDDADLNRFEMFMNPRPVFMDNSMQVDSRWGQYGGSIQYAPGKIRLFNLFEPFNNTDIKDLYPKIDTNLFLINQPALNEIDIIRLATAADFLWNMKNYSQDQALWKVLTSRYGVETARELIQYADNYALMLEIILKLEMNVQTARNFKSGQETIADLTTLVAKISDRLGPKHKLVRDLQLLNADLRNKLNVYLTNNVSK